MGGIFFALVAGQPMMITGATGPLLLLDDALFVFCRSYGFHFLAARMYCGLWMIVIALCIASIEGSVAVKKITRLDNMKLKKNDLSFSYLNYLIT